MQSLTKQACLYYGNRLKNNKNSSEELVQGKAILGARGDIRQEW